MAFGNLEEEKDRRMLTRYLLQRVLVERPSIGWELYPWAADRERIFWKGLFGNAQAHKRFQSTLSGRKAWKE